MKQKGLGFEFGCNKTYHDQVGLDEMCGDGELIK